MKAMMAHDLARKLLEGPNLGVLCGKGHDEPWRIIGVSSGVFFEDGRAEHDVGQRVICLDHEEDVPGHWIVDGS